MPTAKHSFDQVAEDLADYIESSIDYLTLALLEDGHAPFEAEISETERIDYFDNLIWENGLPNQEGRRFLEEQYGLDEYIRIYRWLESKKSRSPRGAAQREASGSESDVTETPY